MFFADLLFLWKSAAAQLCPCEGVEESYMPLLQSHEPPQNHRKGCFTQGSKVNHDVTVGKGRENRF